MDLYDITTLQRDINQNNLYDLIESTFVMNYYPPLSMIVLPEQEMRVDLISFSLYGTTDYVDLIMDLNGIDNPLNIMSGDIINYIDLSQLDSYRQSTNTTTSQRNILLNSSKSQVDNNRQQYIENNYQLPPTFLQTPGSPIVISQGTITIKPIS